MPLDRNLLVKVLLQTESDNDHVALTAIRKANKMLKDAGVRWTGLISGSREKLKVAGDAPPWVEPEPEVSLREAFQILESEGELIDEYRDWYGWYAKFGRLEPDKVARVFRRLREVQDVSG